MNVNDIQPGLYRHFRNGKHYEVIGVAIHSETKEEMVVYIARYDCDVYGFDQLWVRPKSMFAELVEHQGELVQRFVPIR